MPLHNFTLDPGRTPTENMHPAVAMEFLADMARLERKQFLTPEEAQFYFNVDLSSPKRDFLRDALLPAPYSGINPVFHRGVNLQGTAVGLMNRLRDRGVYTVPDEVNLLRQALR